MASETPLFEEMTSKAPCEGQLADLQAAVSNMADRVEAIVTAVNSLGEITETIQQQITSVVDFIGEFQRRFAGMSPADMIKSMLKGGV